MFGFDDFALLFAEAAPELLATETASATAAELAAEEAAREAAVAAAQQAATQTAAQEAAQSGILQASQMNPELLNSINGPGVKTADMSSGLQDYWEKVFGKPVDLNPPDYRALNTEQLFAQDAAKASMNSVPPGLEAEINSQYYGQNLGGDMGPGIKDAALNANTAQYPLSPSSNLGPGGPYPGERFVPGGNLGPGGPYPGEPYVPGGQLGPTAEEYRNLAANTDKYPLSPSSDLGPSKEMEEFHRALNERSAAAPPSNIQHFDNPASTTQNVFRGNPAEAGFQPPQVTKGGYFNNGINGEYTDTLTPFERGMDTAGRYFDKTTDYIEKNPYKSAGLAYYGAYKTGMLDQKPVEAPADDYKNPYSMVGFRRSSPNPSAYQYRPRYAEGGIASIHSYKKGGRSKTEAAMDFYDAMNSEPAAAPSLGNVGIYYDMDPDTRYLDPMEAAMVRMSKLNSRTNVQAPTMTPNRRMGELDFKPVAAAQGGIMGYADGGLYNTYKGNEQYEKLGKPGPTKAEILSAALAAAYGGSRNTSHINIDNGYYPTSSIPTTTDMPTTSTAIGGGGGGGNRGSADGSDGAPGEGFSPTSEGAYAVSTLGQNLGYISPVTGAILGAIGTNMAKNVNPNYSHEGLNAPPAPTQSTNDGTAGEAAAKAALDSGEAAKSLQATYDRATSESSPTASNGIASLGVSPTQSANDGNAGQAAAQAAQAAATQAARDAATSASSPTATGGEANGGGGGGGGGGNGDGGRNGAEGRGDPGGDRGGWGRGGGYAHGGIASIHAPYNLGGYAAGGNPRLLRGPGDGMSDNIPATINNRQPARLADGEFVVPADVVSHLGNGSTEAGAKQLDAMMTRIRKGRTGNPKQGKKINPSKYLPA